MNTSVINVAKKLADAHRLADPATTTIKYFPSPEIPVIRLLEVSSAAPTTGEVLPFKFAADESHGVDYPSVVVLLSPEEWQRIEESELALPDGWVLDEAVTI